jgi:hypothetical protein
MTVTVSKKLTKLKTNLMLLSLLSIGTFIFTQQLFAADNPYQENYKAQNTNQLKSANANPETKIEIKNQKITDNSIDVDNVRMLEDGYDMMGWSGFSANEAPADLALSHGRAVQADHVILYSKHEAENNKSADIKSNPDAQDLHYFYASYWAKLPMPLLGVHVVKLRKLLTNQKAATASASEELPEEPGLKVIAVIKSSPAAEANILRGDVLMKVGDAAVNQQEALVTAVKRYSGQSVPVVLIRNNKELTVTAKLNSRS